MIFRVILSDSIAAETWHQDFPTKEQAEKYIQRMKKCFPTLHVERKAFIEVAW